CFAKRLRCMESSRARSLHCDRKPSRRALLRGKLLHLGRRIFQRGHIRVNGVGNFHGKKAQPEKRLKKRGKKRSQVMSQVTIPAPHSRPLFLLTSPLSQHG